MWFFIASLLISLVLLNLEYIFKFLKIESPITYFLSNKILSFCESIDTLIHELGHSLVGVLFGATAKKMNIGSDGGGNVTINGIYKKGAIFTTLSGYTFSTLMISVLVVLLFKAQYGFVIAILLFITFMSLVLLIRNIYGWVFGSTFILMLLVLISQVDNSDVFVPFIVTFIVICTMIANIKSVLVVFKLSRNSEVYSGDCSDLEGLTQIQAKHFGTFFLIFSSVIYILTLFVLIKF